MRENNKLWLFEVTLEQACKMYEEGIYLEIKYSSPQLKDSNMNQYIITKKKEK